MKRADIFFNHAEISPQCVETHGEAGVWQEAARRLQKTFDEMLRRLKEQPNGRIVMAIGWKNPTENDRIDAEEERERQRLLQCQHGGMGHGGKSNP